MRLMMLIGCCALCGCFGHGDRASFWKQDVGLKITENDSPVQGVVVTLYVPNYADGRADRPVRLRDWQDDLDTLALRGHQTATTDANGVCLVRMNAGAPAEWGDEADQLSGRYCVARLQKKNHTEYLSAPMTVDAMTPGVRYHLRVQQISSPYWLVPRARGANKSASKTPKH
jgi:hypothetical protein